MTSPRGIFVSVAAVVLAFALPAIRAAPAAEAPAMLVGTRDPALLSALDAAFAPRGVRVAMADRSLRATGDDLGAGARSADLVWLCDVTPASVGAQPSTSGAPTATALCVRPHQGTVIIRRVSVPTPLSPEDAAALALSVQVLLMPDGSLQAETIASPAPAPEPELAPRDSAPDLTLELSYSIRNDPGTETARPGVAAVYSPWLDHHLGLGVALGLATWDRAPVPTGAGPGPQARVTYTTLRLFARRQARLGPIWLQLDLGPEVYLIRGEYTQSGPGGLVEDRLRYQIVGFLDGFLGAVVPLGRFFVGARAGTAYVVTGDRASVNPFTGRWSTEALATGGVGWF